MSRDKVKLAKFDRVPRVPVISASRTLGTGQAERSQPPKYPGNRRGSVFSGPQVRFILARRCPLRAPGALGTGGTQSFQPPSYLRDWRDFVLSAPEGPSGRGGLTPLSPQGTLGTGGTQLFQLPSNARDRVIPKD